SGRFNSSPLPDLPYFVPPTCDNGNNEDEDDEDDNGPKVVPGPAFLAAAVAVAVAVAAVAAAAPSSVVAIGAAFSTWRRSNAASAAAAPDCTGRDAK
ncbi:hypothetical protein VOLCADRAFT_117594, partial [Volvox carteri f. nagariensis]